MTIEAAATHERMSGILLHVTSLPSYGGIGDFGPAAYAFVALFATGFVSVCYALVPVLLHR